MEGGIVDRLVVAVTYQYDAAGARQIKSDFLGLAALAGTVALAGAKLAASTAQDIERMKRLGDALNLGTQGAFEFRHVFEAVGAEVNDVSDALQTLSDYALEAASGNKTWVQTFKDAGIAISDLKDKDPAELLNVVADGMAELGSTTKRAALASRLFGDDVGRKLLPLLIRGREGIAELREEARIFGGIITDDQAEAASHLAESLRQLSSIPAGLGRRIGVHLIPPIQHLTDDLHDWYLANGDLIGQQTDKVVDDLAFALEALNTPVGRAVAGATALAAAWGAAGAAKEFATAVGAANPLAGAMLSQAGSAATLAKRGGALALVLGGLYVAWDDVQRTAEGNDSVLLRLAGTMGAEGEMQGAAKGLTEALTGLYEISYAAGAVGLQAMADTASTLLARFPELATYAYDLADALEDLAPKVLEVLGTGWSTFGEMASMKARELTGTMTDTDKLVAAAYQQRQDRAALDAMNAADPIPARGRGHRTHSDPNGPVILPSPTVINVSRGMTPEEVAYIAAEQRRQEILDAMETVSEGEPPVGRVER